MRAKPSSKLLSNRSCSRIKSWRKSDKTSFVNGAISTKPTKIYKWQDKALVKGNGKTTLQPNDQPGSTSQPEMTNTQSLSHNSSRWQDNTLAKFAQDYNLSTRDVTIAQDGKTMLLTTYARDYNRSHSRVYRQIDEAKLKSNLDKNFGSITTVNGPKYQKTSQYKVIKITHKIVPGCPIRLVYKKTLSQQVTKSLRPHVHTSVNAEAVLKGLLQYLYYRKDLHLKNPPAQQNLTRPSRMAANKFDHK